MFKWIKNLFAKLAPKLKEILGFVVDQIQALMIEAGTYLVESIKAKIIEVSELPLSNSQKFDLVANFAKGLAPTMKEHALDILIQSIFNWLKSRAKV